MGGSGGGYFSGSYGPDELARRARAAEDDARSADFDAAVAKHLGDLLAQYNRRDVPGIQRVLDRVVEDLGESVTRTVTTLFGGSVAKHTYVDGISDVDALVLFDNADVKGKGPKDVKAVLAGHLRDRYGHASVVVGKLAVTVSLDGQTIQLLPAVRSGTGFRIPSGADDKWSRIAPRRFAQALTRHNERLGHKLVPCIKLIKAVMATLPERQRLTGYHTEAMAINVFRSYVGSRQTKPMLRFFFEHASDHVTRPIKDTSGQSVYVDEYLGKKGSGQRRVIGYVLDRIGRRIRNADGAGSVRRWEELFE